MGIAQSLTKQAPSVDAGWMKRDNEKNSSLGGDISHKA
jgi:hypothetical protein